MENKFYISAIICVCFVILTLLDIKILGKELLPVKEIFKNTIIVFASVVAGLYILSYITIPEKPGPEIFTSTPDF